jgi:hypothetical protein
MDSRQNDDEAKRVADVTAAIRALETPAPASLRAAVEAAAAEAQARQAAPAQRRGGLRPRALADALGRMRPRTLVAGTGALAALVAVVLVLALPGGGSATPTVPAVASVALRSAAQPAPAAQPGGRLDAAVQDVSFPDWSGWSSGPGGGWRATGARSDEVGDRSVRTVFYANYRGQRIGYAIADGERLPVGSGRWAERNGVPMWIYDVGGETAVMWYRDGLTCVVSGRGVDAATLQALAAARPA